MFLILFIVLVALAFEFIDGFHDTANAIATVVATKVLLPMVLAPLLGIVFGFIAMGLLLAIFHARKPATINRVFRKCQFLSAAWMSFSHGMNDAQKTMGVIALTLYTATTQTDAFAHLPDWLGFLRAPEFKVYTWI